MVLLLTTKKPYELWCMLYSSLTNGLIGTSIEFRYNLMQWSHLLDGYFLCQSYITHENPQFSLTINVCPKFPYCWYTILTVAKNIKPQLVASFSSLSNLSEISVKWLPQVHYFFFFYLRIYHLLKLLSPYHGETIQYTTAFNL